MSDNSNRLETPVVVLDCSHIGNSTEFVKRYNEVFEGFAPKISSIEELLEMPEVQPPLCFIEIRNVEKLRASAPALFGQLEALSGLEEARFKVDIFRFGSGPRGVLYQHDKFKSFELKGELAAAVLSTSDPDCQLLWVKPELGYWQRFYVDAGLACWEEFPEEDAFLGFDDRLLTDLGGEHCLVGSPIGVVRAPGNGSLAVEIGPVLIEIKPEEPADFEAKVLLSVSRSS